METYRRNVIIIIVAVSSALSIFLGICLGALFTPPKWYIEYYSIPQDKIYVKVFDSYKKAVVIVSNDFDTVKQVELGTRQLQRVKNDGDKVMFVNKKSIGSNAFTIFQDCLYMFNSPECPNELIYKGESLPPIVESYILPKDFSKSL